MKFERQGKIEISQLSEWQKYYQMTPTPIKMGGVCRIITGFVDSNNVSRVGYVDVDAKNPSRVINISKEPLLDIGRRGCFDDNGVVPTCIIDVDEKLYLYYVGFQQGVKVPYYMFGGLAVSEDGGNTFYRYSESPILDRTGSEIYHRCGIFVRKEKSVFKMWYIGTNKEGWTEYNGKQLPLYVMKYIESSDGITWSHKGTDCMKYESDDEHGMGRPYVWEEGGKYRMLFCVRTYSRGYQIAYAESDDGISWNRSKEKVIDLARCGFDDMNQSYPYLFDTGEDMIMFYNGNGCGKTGFGYAKKHRDKVDK